MPVPVVAVELATEDAASPAAAVLIETCSQAVRRGRCVLAAGKQLESEVPAAVAIVSWQSPDHQRLHVQVGTRVGESARWVERDVVFGRNDPELERWRSAGLTIAILIGELPEARALMGGDAPEEPTDSPVPSPPASQPGAAATPTPAVAAVVERPSRTPEARPLERGARARRMVRGFVDAAAFVGLGLDRGEVRRGGSLAAGYSLGVVPLFVPVRVSYAWRPEDERSLAAQWLGFAVGIGSDLRIPETALSLDARAFAAIEQVTASAIHPTSGREDSAQRWVPALGLAAGPAYSLGGWLAVFVHAEVWRSFRVMAIYNADEVVAHTRLWTGGAQVGLRLTFQ